MRFSFFEGDHGRRINSLYFDFVEEIANENLKKCDLKIDDSLVESKNCLAFNLDMVDNDLIEEGWSEGDLFFFYVHDIALKYCKLKNNYLFKFYTEIINHEYCKYECKINKKQLSCIKQAISS